MKKSNIAATTVITKHIKDTNKAFANINKSNVSLFTAICAAYDALNEYSVSWKEYRFKVDCDDSTSTK